jgi:hypothetical protein
LGKTISDTGKPQFPPALLNITHFFQPAYSFDLAMDTAGSSGTLMAGPHPHGITTSVSYINIYASRCCTDLGDNDLELIIVQGISYNVANPKDVDTDVKYEFPYPSVSKYLY